MNLRILLQILIHSNRKHVVPLKRRNRLSQLICHLVCPIWRYEFDNLESEAAPMSPVIVNVGASAEGGGAIGNKDQAGADCSECTPE